MTNSSNDSASLRRQRRTCLIPCMSAALLMSTSATSAFAPITTATMKSTLGPSRCAIIQRYRAEDEELSNVSQPKHQSDAYSFLPSRLSSIQRLDEPAQFQEQVLGDKESLVVVRFYAEVCPSCRATRPLFTKWSRDLEKNDNGAHVTIDARGVMKKSQQDCLPIKILEMPLNRATSTFVKEELQIDQLPYCHLYHPTFGIVEEQLVANKVKFQKFVTSVDYWSKGGCEADFESIQPNYDQPEEMMLIA